MATVKAKNPITGATFDINPNEFDSLYKPKGWTLVDSAPAQVSAPAPTAPVQTPQPPTAPTNTNQDTQATFAYNQPRVSDLSVEQNKANELATFLDTQKVNGKSLRSTIGADNWNTYVNAYVYGGYSQQDIANDLYARSTKGVGGIVNPKINRTDWFKANPGLTSIGQPTASSGLTSGDLKNGMNAGDLPTSTTNLNAEFTDLAKNSMNNIEQFISKMLMTQRDTIKGQIDQYQTELDKYKGQLEDVTSTDEYTKLLEAKQKEFGIQDKIDKLTDIQTRIANLQGSLNLGQQEIGTQLAPMSLLTRRQSALQEQAMAQIGTLTAIAGVYQGDITLFNNMINQSISALQSSRTEKINALSSFIKMDNDSLITLKDQDKTLFNAEIGLLETANTELTQNADKVKDLIYKYPDIAVKAGISIADTYDQALTKYEDYIGQHPEANPNTPQDQWQVVTNSTTGEQIMYNKNSGEWKSITNNPKPDANIPQTGATGGQCGDYVHSIMDNTPQFGDTWQTKQAAMNTTPEEFAKNPQVGDIVAFKTNLPAGHVAVVTAVNGDGTFQVTESNYNLDEKVSNGRTINVNDPNILGAYRGAAFKQTQDYTQIDPDTQSLLAQTGLSYNAFLVLTGQMSKLPRDKMTRNTASAEVKQWSDNNNIDLSTFTSRYEALNKTVEANLLRNNQAAVAENELDATLKNLETAADDSSFGSMKLGKIAKMFAGQEFNDENVAKYQFHLEQLRREFAMYNAAIEGQIDTNGNIREINGDDNKKAEQIIRDGFASGSLTGFENALKASMSKMGIVLQNSVDAQNKQVWNLFGVGDKYKSTVTTQINNTSQTDQSTSESQKKTQGFWSKIGDWLFGE